MEGKESKETQKELQQYLHTTVVIPFEFPTMRDRWVLKLFTVNSQRPSKWGALSGMKCPCMEQKSHMVFLESRRLAPTKLVPCSLHIDEGLPLLATNLTQAGFDDGWLADRTLFEVQGARVYDQRLHPA